MSDKQQEIIENIVMKTIEGFYANLVRTDEEKTRTDIEVSRFLKIKNVPGIDYDKMWNYYQRLYE